MSTGNVPSKDPANDATLAGVFRQVFGKLLQNTDDMLPAEIISYDREKNIATVRPLVMVITTDDNTVSRAQIAQVPVLALGGGGFVVTFPLKKGDKGWIKANDRDISLYLQGLRESQPNTLRMHSFEDGLFIPDVLSQYTLAEDVGADDMAIQSLDGSIRLIIGPSRVRVVHPTLIELQAPLTKVIGAFEVTETSELTGHVNAPGGAEISGIEFVSHTHGGVDTGPGNTGPPE